MSKGRSKGRSKKAFTLVELVAIILILSVLAVIATPIVSNVVEESRKNSFGVTCKQIFSAVERYVDFNSESSCFVFDFSQNITETEMIDGVQYQPINKLQLSGQLPLKGQAKYCDGAVEVYADDGSNTCLVNEEMSNVLEGTIENIDITAPVLESITLTSTTSSISVVANAKEPDGKIVKYYYSLDGKTYKESDSHTYQFKNLKNNTEYTVYVRVENESGLLSKRITKKVFTKQMNNPIFSENRDDIDENFEYAPKRVIEIEYSGENIITPSYYFKTSVTASVEEGAIDGICGSDVSPNECNEDSVTELVAGIWYKTSKELISVTYKREGILYAAVSDGTNLSGTSTYSVVNIDATGPSAELSIGSVKTSQVTLIASCEDLDTGIVKYEYSKDGGKNWVDQGTQNEYTFTKLTSETVYTFAIKCTNASGLTATDSDTSTTAGLVNPSIDQVSQTPSKEDGYEYATHRVIGITYRNTNIESPEYYFKSSTEATVSTGVIVYSCGNGTTPGTCQKTSTNTLVPGAWYRTNEIKPTFNYTSNGTLYALISDGTNVSGTATYEISNMDISEPSVSVSITDVKTDRVTVNATCADSQSGIIKYEYSKDNGKNWIDNGKNKTYTFTGLSQGTEYTYSVRCTNGTGILTNIGTGKDETKVVANPSFELASQTPSKGYEYYTSRTIKIKYVSTDVANPIYYFKSNVDVKVASGVVNGICGKGTTPTGCYDSSATTIVANTWYRTANETPNVIYEANGTLYALTGDGTNISGTATYAVSNVDRTEPSVAITVSDIKTDRATVTASCGDSESGIIKYEFSKDNGVNWINNGTKNSHTFTGLTQGTNYTYAVRCTNGASLTSVINSKNITATIVNPSFKNTSNVPSSGYSYYTNRTYQITYSNTGIVSPLYYFKSNVSATVSGGTVSASCGTGTVPGECTAVSNTTVELIAGTWYKTASQTPTISFTKNGTIYALTSDGANTSGTSTYTVSEIDTSVPDAKLEIGTIKTDSVVLNATCSDSQSGITKYEFSKDGGSTYTSNGTNSTYTFTKLKQATKYSFAVRCTNGSAITATAKKDATTVSINAPTFANIENSPDSGYSYYTSRTYKITFDKTNVASPIYYFKTNVAAKVASGVVKNSCGTGDKPSTCSSSSATTLTANTWYVTTTINPNVIFEANGKLYAATGDGTNLSAISEQLVSNVDTSAPSLTLSTIETTTSSIIVSFTASDPESDILTSKTTCVYGTSTSYGKTGTISGNSCVMSDLNQDATYYYKITVTNGASKATSKTASAKTSKLQNPTFENPSNVPNSGYSYYTSRTIKIIYSAANITSPEYYFKANVSTTVSSGIVTGICGTGTTPGTCSASSATTLSANTWYKTNTATPSVVFASNGTLYALTSDGTNVSGTSTYAVSNIDTSKPSVSLSVGTIKTDRVTLTATCSDSESGIVKYEFSKDGGNTYTSNGTTNTYTFTGLTQGTSYTFGVRCTNGSALTNTSTVKGTTVNIVAPIIDNSSNTPSSGYSYYTKRVYKVTYSNTNITSPVYYFKSTVSATVGSGVVTASCGTGTNPGTCSTSSATSVTANTWYKTTTVMPSITYTSNGTLYVRTYDAKGNYQEVSKEITNIDTSAPNLTLSAATKTTNSITIPFTASDAESGILTEKTTCVYGTSTTYDKSGKISGSSCVLSGLTQGTTYYYKIIVENGSSSKTEKTGSAKTGGIENPKFSVTNTPSSGYSYYTKRVVEISYSDAGITNPEYYFKSTVAATASANVYACTDTKASACGTTGVTSIAANTWYKATTATPSITYTANGTLYALTSDGTNISGTSTYSVTNIDISAPSLTLSTAAKTTNSITIPFTASDVESGILTEKTTCVYGTSTTYGKSGKISGSSCVLSGLTQGTTYYYKVTVENGSSMTTSKTGSSNTGSIKIPKFSVTNTPSSGYSYYTKRVVKITYDSSDMTGPEYYFKSTVSATVGSGVVTASCGTGTNPGTCSTSSVTTLAANTWYKASSTTASITYTANGTLYAVSSDGAQASAVATYSISNIDITEPPITLNVGNIKTDRVTLTVNCTDAESGIVKYEFSKDGGSTYISNGTSASYTYTGLTAGTEYTFASKCTNGSGLTATATAKAKPDLPPTPTFTVVNTPSKDYTYYTKRVVTITYTSANITSPVYYFKSNVSATVGSGVVAASCGTGTNPGTCSTSSVTTLVANTWYKASSTTASITYTANGTLYATTSDGVNLSTAATYNVTNMDTSAPSLTLGTAIPKTDNITIPITATDSQSGIKTTTCVYGTSTSYGSTGTISGSNCVISGLTKGTTYYYKITTTNNSGLTATQSGSSSTLNIIEPKISVPSTCATSKKVTITFDGSNITTPTYKYSTDGTNWTTSSSTTAYVTFTTNGTIYARTYDAKGNYTQSSKSVTVDVSAPSLTLSATKTTTDSIEVSFTASDSDSTTAVTTTCVYGTSESYGSTGTISGGKCIMSNLTQETKYYYKLTTTDCAGRTTTKTGSATTDPIVPPKFSVTNTPSSGYSYYTKRVVTITYSAANTSSITYEYSTDGKTWKTATNPQDVVFTSNGTLYAKATDAKGNYKTSTYSVSNIDTSTPAKPTITASDSKASGSWHTANTTLSFSGASATSGITYYYGTSSSKVDTAGSSVTISSNTAGTTYYVKACNGAGTCGETASYSLKLDKTPVCTPTITAGDGIASGSWHTADTKLSFSCSSTPISGVTFYYGTSSSSITTVGTSVTRTSNTSGTTYYVKACNGAGICGSAASYTIKLDKDTPVAPTITANDGKSSGACHKAGVTLTFSGSSATSGVTYYYGTSTSTMTSTGTSVSRTSNTSGLTYYVKACSGAGKCSSNSSYTIKLDTSTPAAPTITATDGITSGNWHLDNTTLNFDGSSSSCGVTYYYGTSTSSMTSTGTSVTRTSDTSGLTYYVKACDEAGTCSSNSSYSLKVDKGTPAAPKITANDGVASGSWHTANTTLTFSGSSATSGITYYYGTSSTKVDTAASSVSRTSNTSGVTYYVKACSAVRCSSNSSYTLKVDMDTPPPPTITATDGITSGNWHKTSPVKLTISGSSATSGITYYYGTSTSSMTAGSTVSYSGETSGTTYYAKACNGAGKCSSNSSYTIKTDTTVPICTVSVSGYNATINCPGISGYAITSSTSTPTSWSSSSSLSTTWSPSTYGSYGTYYVHVKDAAGNTNYKAITISAASYNYSATPGCSGGRTYDSSTGNCKMSYTNNEAQCGCAVAETCPVSECGVESYKSCQNSACGNATCATSACGVSSYKSCATSGNGCKTYNSCQHSSCGNKECATSACGNKECATSACGCSVYNTCTDASFGCATYKSCPTAGCGVAAYFSCADPGCGYATCQNTACGCRVNKYCYDSSNNRYVCGCNEYASCSTSGCGYATCEIRTCGIKGYNTCADSACGCATYNSKAASPCSCKTYKTCANSACGYKTCANSACGYKSCPNSSCTCAEYVTAPNSACGVASYKSCQHADCGYATCATSGCGVSSYKSCANIKCGCKTGGSCTKTENAYLTYSCPKGGTLSGTTCRFDI